jgi:hypothetical protein
MTQRPLGLSIDVECLGRPLYTRSGEVCQGDQTAGQPYLPIAWGACLMAEDAKILKRFERYIYFPEFDPMEKRCYDEFWSKHADTLQLFDKRSPRPLESSQPRDRAWVERAKWHAVNEFLAWQQDCLRLAKERDTEICLVADNAAYDVARMNMLFAAHPPPQNPYPWPYLPEQGYSLVFETQSAATMLLAQLDQDGSLGNGWNVEKRILHYYDVPAQYLPITNDTHEPAEDAACIGRFAMLLQAIARGEINRH